MRLDGESGGSRGSGEGDRGKEVWELVWFCVSVDQFMSLFFVCRVILEGFSTFVVNSDGQISLHRIDKVFCNFGCIAVDRSTDSYSHAYSYSTGDACSQRKESSTDVDSPVGGDPRAHTTPLLETSACGRLC